MTETTPSSSNGLSLRTLCHIAYGLFAAAVLTIGFLGVGAVAAAVLAYMKRPDAAGTVYASHLDWLITTFWWGLLWLAISYICTYFYIGWIGVAATVIWLIYRLIKGWLSLCEGQAAGSNA